MALLFFDSFEHYTIASDKWTNQRGATGSTLQTTTGRFGLGFQAFNGRYLTKVLGANYGTLIAGFAFQPNASGDTGVCAFFDGATNQCHLRYVPSTGTWQAYRGNTSLGSNVALVAPGQFHYVEVKVVFHATTGSITVKADGVTVLNLTNVNTGQSGNNQAGIFILGAYDDGTPVFVFDDVYIVDTSGSAPTNDYLGDVRVECRMPDGNGATSNLVGSDGNSTDNYLLVDEATPNGDTDYVESSTPGDKDTYTFQNLVTTAGTVYGVQVLPYAKKTDAGARSVKSIARISTTEVDGPEKALSTSYQYLSDIRETKPGGGAWTISDVNSAEFGVKVFA